MGRTLRPMSISTTTRKAGPFTGNGVLVSFPFAFKVFAAADVLVVRGEIATAAELPLTLGTHYSVTLNADQNVNPGGTVNWIGTPLSSAFTLTIGSKVTSTQPATFTNLGRFYPRVLNDALDRLTIVVQQLAEEVGRSVKVGFSGLVSPDELVSTITTAASTATAGASSAASSAETALTVLGDALSAVDAANAAIAGAVQADGSVAMTAELELAGNAAGALGAVPKQQMDSALAGRALLSGSSSQPFSVADASAPAHAVALGQFGASLAANGYQRLPSGLILQWGASGGVQPPGSVGATFPIAFPNQCLHVGGSWSGGPAAALMSVSFSPSGWSAYVDEWSAVNNFGQVFWFAVGY